MSVFLNTENTFFIEKNIILLLFEKNYYKENSDKSEALYIFTIKGHNKLY